MLPESAAALRWEGAGAVDFVNEEDCGGLGASDDPLAAGVGVAGAPNRFWEGWNRFLGGTVAGGACGLKPLKRLLA